MRIIAEAQQDIEEAWSYLEDQGAGLGVEYLDELEKLFESIRFNAESFARLETLPEEVLIRRGVLNKFRYAIVFEVVNDEAVVLAIYHASREPNWWLYRREGRSSSL